MSRKGVWTGAIILGLLLILGAAALALSNLREDRAAGETSGEVLDEVSAIILAAVNGAGPGAPAAPAGTDPLLERPLTLPRFETSEQEELAAVTVRELAYIGVITFPSLGLQLPVQEEWSYAGLQASPCRFYGSPHRDNLVICAHNYITHFGRLRDLSAGDAVEFTDLEGTTFRYTVAAAEILPPDATPEVAGGEWPLTLFTCTIGGRARVVVRCDFADAEE